jgi:hypothetical protein
VGHDAGVVDQDVDAAEPRVRVGDERGDRVGVGDVGLDDVPVAVVRRQVLAQRVGGLRRPLMADDARRAVAGEGQGDRAADAA